MEQANAHWGRTGRGLPANWPAGADGAPEEGALCAALPEGPVAGLTQNMLTAYGIPSVCFTGADESVSRTLFGISPYRTGLYVPASRLEEAKALLDADASGDESNPT